MWKSIALAMVLVAILSAGTVGALALEINALKSEIEKNSAATSEHIDVLSEQIQAQADSMPAEFTQVKAEIIKEITMLTAETQNQNSDRFHHSRDISEITGQPDSSQLELEDVINVWEECLEERMGTMGVFYAADMVDWWEDDYWQDLSEDGRISELLYTGRIHGCWE